MLLSNLSCFESVNYRRQALLKSAVQRIIAFRTCFQPQGFGNWLDVKPFHPASPGLIHNYCIGQHYLVPPLSSERRSCFPNQAQYSTVSEKIVNEDSAMFYPLNQYGEQSPYYIGLHYGYLKSHAPAPLPQL